MYILKKNGFGTFVCMCPDLKIIGSLNSSIMLEIEPRKNKNLLMDL
jgi:hypothetical protein